MIMIFKKKTGRGLRGRPGRMCADMEKKIYQNCFCNIADMISCFLGKKKERRVYMCVYMCVCN